MGAQYWILGSGFLLYDNMAGSRYTGGMQGFTVDRYNLRANKQLIRKVVSTLFHWHSRNNFVSLKANTIFLLYWYTLRDNGQLLK